MVPIYCINVKSSTERRKRMDHRFKTAGLEDTVLYVDAVNPHSNLIDYYDSSLKMSQDKGIETIKRIRSCMASHIKAIRTLLSDSLVLDNNINDYAIICEDDVMLHNNFKEKFQGVIDNMPGDCPLVSLSYLIWNYSGMQWAGKIY